MNKATATAPVAKKITQTAFEKALQSWATDDTKAAELIAAQDKELEPILTAYNSKFKAIEENKAACFETISRYTAENRSLLFPEKKKSTSLFGVKLSFRASSGKVVIDEGIDQPTLIAALLKKKLLAIFVIKKPELDKAAIKKAWEDPTKAKEVKALTAAGIDFVKGESFTIERG